MTSVRIRELYLFPVKSLRGFRVEQSPLTPLGFHYDRQWMIIKPDGGFISQRQLPQMVLIHTRITEDALILSKAGMPDIAVPLAPVEGELITARVWKDECKVIDTDSASSNNTVSRWLSEALDSPKPLRLVRMAPNHQRPQSKPELLGERTHTLFADAAPFLVCNQGSLEQLNQQLEQHQLPTVTMERFRPNVVIEGIPAFAEHEYQGLKHTQFELSFCYPCQRCAVPTIDIDTAQRHPQQQPFKLLGTLNPMPDKPKVPAFGENSILTRTAADAVIAQGDTLEIIT